jgi:hypothetical protein
MPVLEELNSRTMLDAQGCSVGTPQNDSTWFFYPNLWPLFLGEGDN